jgi:hypothetical protein
VRLYSPASEQLCSGRIGWRRFSLLLVSLFFLFLTFGCYFCNGNAVGAGEREESEIEEGLEEEVLMMISIAFGSMVGPSGMLILPR